MGVVSDYAPRYTTHAYAYAYAMQPLSVCQAGKAKRLTSPYRASDWQIDKVEQITDNRDGRHGMLDIAL